VKLKINEFIKEDVPNGDITTHTTVTEDKVVSAKMIAMESFIFCGEEYLPSCFPRACITKVVAKDGVNVKSGDVLAHIDGPANQILTFERVILNLTQRLCGISTETYKYCKLDLPKGFKVMDTRKTTPGLRLFEKHAVSVGGGWNHRLDLSSAILIKDNHIQAAGSIEKTLNNIKNQNNRDVPIELEVDTINQLREGLKYDLDGFLLDNMKPEEVKKCVELIRKEPNGEMFFIEASGGINFETLESYAGTGIDGVSMSAITANAPSVDIKLEFNHD
jgi:nicotinate-nucleotide pyrophosphorylase (carboxylating)